MESVFFDSNPSIRQFTDNAQRANNMLHRTQNREMKSSKTSKTTNMDSADMSSQANVSSGDMMGGMDFGDNRGSGGDLDFSFYEQSEERREQLREEAKRYSQQQQEILQEEKRMTDFIKALRGDEPEKKKVYDREFLENHGLIEKTPGDTAGTSIQEKIEEAADEPQAVNEKAHSEKSSIIEDSPPSQTKSKKTEKSGIKEKKAQQKSSAGLEKVERSSTPAERQSQAPAGESWDKKSEWNSLLSLDDGFIIAKVGADDKENEVQAGKIQSPELSFETIELPTDLDNVTSGVESIITSMLASELSSEYIRSVLNYQLGSFGPRVLKLCSNFGVKIMVKSSPIDSMFPGENFSPHSACAYIAEQKLCVLDEKVLTYKEEFVSSRFFMAIAFDHALGGGIFSSQKSAAVLSSYGLCKENEPGHSFCDSFASSSPIFYFAQAVESYLRKPGDTTQSHIYDHDGLYDYDRSMFMYIDYLFNEMNRSGAA